VRPSGPVRRLPADGEQAHSAASSFGSLIRLQAAAVRAKVQPTRALPRWRVFRSPPLVLIQPNASSMRLRIRWLTA